MLTCAGTVATDALTVVLGMGVGVIMIGPLAKLADPTPSALATNAADNRRFFILNVYTSELCLMDLLPTIFVPAICL